MHFFPGAEEVKNKIKCLPLKVLDRVGTQDLYYFFLFFFLPSIIAHGFPIGTGGKKISGLFPWWKIARGPVFFQAFGNDPCSSKDAGGRDGRTCNVNCRGGRQKCNWSQRPGVALTSGSGSRSTGGGAVD